MNNDTAPAHSKLSPSKGYQWTRCTASIGYIAANRHRLPPDVSSPQAAEGTKAHHVGEACILGEPVGDYATKEMIRFGKEYAALCLDQRGPLSQVVEWGVERRTPLVYLPEEKGTIDFFVLNERGLFITDYKYGFSPVESVGNKQMAIYAASLIEWESGLGWPVITDDTKITMTIYQPRLEQDTVQWVTTWGELRAFVEKEIMEPARRILDGGKVEFHPDDKVCKWCPAASFCEARKEWLLQDLYELRAPVDDDAVLPAVITLTDERLVRLWSRRGEFLKFFDEIEEYLQKRQASASKVKGLKWVTSKGGHRYWTDEQKAVAILNRLGVQEDDIYSKKVASPAQAEKLIHHMKGELVGRLHALMAKPPGKPMLALESDPREKHHRAVALSDFADLIENSDETL